MYKECDIKLKYILYAFCAVLFINQLNKINNNNNKNEFFNTSEATEALQNIASLYNTGNFTVSNLNVTGSLNVAGNSLLSNTITNGTLDVKGDSTFEGNAGISKNLTVSGSSTLAGINNQKGITTDYINAINNTTKGSIQNDGNSITFINGDSSKTKWQMYNMAGVLRTYPMNSAVCMDISYDPSNNNNTIKSAWQGSDGAYRAEIGTQPPAIPSRATQDGYIHKYNSNGGDWYA